MPDIEKVAARNAQLNAEPFVDVSNWVKCAGQTPTEKPIVLFAAL